MLQLRTRMTVSMLLVNDRVNVTAENTCFTEIVGSICGHSEDLRWSTAEEPLLCAQTAEADSCIWAGYALMVRAMLSSSLKCDSKSVCTCVLHITSYHHIWFDEWCVRSHIITSWLEALWPKRVVCTCVRGTCARVSGLWGMVELVVAVPRQVYLQDSAL